MALCDFIMDAKITNKKHIDNSIYNLFCSIEAIKDSIYYYKKSSILNHYILEDKNTISNIINKTFSECSYIYDNGNQIKVSINYEPTIEYIISKKFIIEYFKQISSYSDLYKNILDNIERILI